MSTDETREAADVRGYACEAIYRALNRKMGEPDQGSGTNSKRWDMAWEATDALASAGLLVSNLPAPRADDDRTPARFAVCLACRRAYQDHVPTRTLGACAEFKPWPVAPESRQ